MKTKSESDAFEQAIGRSAMASIREMVEALQSAEDAGDDAAREDAERTIQEDPLSIEVRSDWHAPGDSEAAPSEYKILLSTGGPATRIIGDLNEYCEPISATLEAQNWFTSWGVYHGTSPEDEAALLTYARRFWFGE